MTIRPVPQIGQASPRAETTASMGMASRTGGGAETAVRAVVLTAPVLLGLGLAIGLALLAEAGERHRLEPSLGDLLLADQIAEELLIDFGLVSDREMASAIAERTGLLFTGLRGVVPDVNLFVDHSQIVQLECLRSGVWGTNDVWGRVHTYTE